jgi:serine protease Do
MALESLLKQGRIIRGYLGIQSRPSSPNQPAPDTSGVVVDEVVPASPAADAHLQKGDIIQKFDGRDVKTISQLRSLVSQVELNKKVDLEVVRDGKPMKVTTQIKEQPVDYQTRGFQPQPNQPQPPGRQQPGEENGRSGVLASVRVSDLTSDMARQLDLPNGVRGVVVTDVDPDSGMAELQKGDVIEEVNQQPVPSVADYNKVVSSLDANQPQVLSVCRHRARSFLVVRPR